MYTQLKRRSTAFPESLDRLTNWACDAVSCAMLRLRNLLTLCLCLASGAAWAQARFGSTLDGKPLGRLAPEGTKAVVLFFVATECPVSNRAFPEMERLREAYGPRNIRFLYVYPNAGETPDDIRTHQASYDPQGTPILDPDAALVHLTHVFVTPEAAILTPAPHLGWKLAYVGRIDDRFVHIGLQRPNPTQLLADRALTQLVASQPITPDSGTPIGCTITPAHSPR
jgi:hypothetical protein